jgi:hypothetical protein
MARLAKNEVNDGRAMLVEVRSTEGLGVTTAPMERTE